MDGVKGAIAHLTPSMVGGLAAPALRHALLPFSVGRRAFFRACWSDSWGWRAFSEVDWIRPSE